MSEDPLTKDPNAASFQAPQPEELPMPSGDIVSDEAIFNAAHNVVDGPIVPEVPTQPEATPSNPNVLSKAEWHDAADQAFIEAKKTGKPLSIIFADISAFKAVNDTLGHDEGDRVIKDLQGVFALVSHSFRTEHTSPEDTRPLDVISVSEIPQSPALTVPESEDINARPGRVGGDEFTILCETDEAGAKAVKERLEKVFYSYMDMPSSQKLRDLGVDIAVGVTSMQPEDESASDMLRRADEHMYEDKLTKLPDLDDDQKQAIIEATRLLTQSGVRQRDVPKYLKKFERTSQSHPQLPFES